MSVASSSQPWHRLAECGRVQGPGPFPPSGPAHEAATCAVVGEDAPPTAVPAARCRFLELRRRSREHPQDCGRRGPGRCCVPTVAPAGPRSLGSVRAAGLPARLSVLAVGFLLVPLGGVIYSRNNFFPAGPVWICSTDLSGYCHLFRAKM